MTKWQVHRKKHTYTMYTNKNKNKCYNDETEKSYVCVCLWWYWTVFSTTERTKWNRVLCCRDKQPVFFSTFFGMFLWRTFLIEHKKNGGNLFKEQNFRVSGIECTLEIAYPKAIGSIDRNNYWFIQSGKNDQPIWPICRFQALNFSSDFVTFILRISI